MKTVITDAFAVNPGDLSWDWLKKYGEYTAYDKLSDSEAAELIADADIVFTNRVKIGEEVIRNSKNLKYVSALGTGYDMIDVKKCRENGIEVCNVPGYSTASVAQHAFTLLLANAFELDKYAAMVKNGKWTGIPGFKYQEAKFVELEGKCVGVYGCGAIGMRFARICKAFGMEVLATKRSMQQGEIDGIRFVSPEQLLERADYVSFHCPLTDETRGMVDSGFIAKMKDGAVIINTSRGAVLNEADVAGALVSGKLGGAGLDVLAKEPADPNNPLLHAPNCIITPHCAWTSKEARERLMNILDENLEHFIKNGEGINRVF